MIRDGDVVLVKASRGVGLERVVAGLVSAGETIGVARATGHGAER
jgi:hypothetical protein